MPTVVAPTTTANYSEKVATTNAPYYNAAGAVSDEGEEGTRTQVLPVPESPTALPSVSDKAETESPTTTLVESESAGVAPLVSPSAQVGPPVEVGGAVQAVALAET